MVKKTIWDFSVQHMLEIISGHEVSSRLHLIASASGSWLPWKILESFRMWDSSGDSSGSGSGSGDSSGSISAAW